MELKKIVFGMRSLPVRYRNQQVSKIGWKHMGFGS